MNYRNLAKRAAALTLAGAMVCGTALATAADGNQAAKKTETVYVTLNSDGSASKATDSVWLHSDTGLSGYSDETTLSDLSMLKNTEQPQQDGDRLHLRVRRDRAHPLVEREGGQAHVPVVAGDDLPQAEADALQRGHADAGDRVGDVLLDGDIPHALRVGDRTGQLRGMVRVADQHADGQ